MVNARLHLICGNCGCPDDWTWKHIKEEVDEGEVMVTEDVYICCGNCSTIHSINSKASKEKRHE
jgi:hypothetical protein